MKLPWWDNPFSPKTGQPGHNEIDLKKGQVWLEKPKDDCIMKTLTTEHIKKNGDHYYLTAENILAIKLWFKRIILIDRKDIIAQCISYEHTYLNPYKQYTEDKVKTEKSGRWKGMFKESKELLHHLSNKLNTPIHYYEDIFSKDKTYRKKYLGQKGLPYNEAWFNSKKRLKNKVGVSQ
jgi:hypothetical protein